MPTTTLRLPEKLSEQIDAWAHKQPDAPGHSEAIRRLVELGLKSPVNKPGRSTRELAAQAIEKIIDPAA
jgi:Arc/MetJ-type ribon-helix-helix transcriptional regulator